MRVAVGMDWRYKFIVTVTLNGKHEFTDVMFSLDCVWHITENMIEAIEIATALVLLGVSAAMLERESPGKAFREAVLAALKPVEWHKGDQKGLEKIAYLTERMVINMRFDETRRTGPVKCPNVTDWKAQARGKREV